MWHLKIKPYNTERTSSIVSQKPIELLQLNENLSLLYDTCFQLATKYREYSENRENSSEFRFSIEQIIVNAMSNDDYKKSVLAHFCEQLDITGNQDKIINMLMWFHHKHTADNISLFELKNHPDILREEILECRSTIMDFWYNQDTADQLYRMSVDSWTLWSIEELEKYKERWEKIADINDYLTSFTKISLAWFALYILKSENISIQTMFELLELWEIVKKHSTEYIAQVFFVLCVFMPTFTKETLEQVKKYFEKKEKALTSKLEHLNFLNTLLQDPIFETVPEVIRSTETIDQLFTDQEIEDYYELLKEKIGNNNDLLKIKFILNEWNKTFKVEASVRHTINALHRKVEESYTDFITELLQRWDFKTNEETALILQDLLDNLSHIEDFWIKAIPVKRHIKKIKG
jgi:hypothetical protein